MHKVRVGVVGVGRGRWLMNYCTEAENAMLVAICDKWVEGLEHARQELGDENITCYSDYDKFLEHKMDVVVLANFANQHAPLAIQAMKKGHHVISEVLPCQNMKEAVALIETVEETGKIYCYAENYCYMAAPREMRRLYRAGEIGQIEYAEGDYAHENDHICVGNSFGDPKHWRNRSYASFYCTHSIGPIIHICGLRPVRVTGFEVPCKSANSCVKGGKEVPGAAVEMITLENGAILRSFHGTAHATSIRFGVYGTKGRLMSDPNLPEGNYATKVYLESYAEEGAYDEMKLDYYEPVDEHSEKAKKLGFSGADYYTLWNCMEKIRGNQEADTIDVYEALDMFLPGMFAHRSILAGGQPMEIPNMRDPAVRDLWRNDTACTDPDAAGDMLLDRYSGGDWEYSEEYIEVIRQRYEAGKSGLRDGLIGYTQYIMPLMEDHPYRLKAEAVYSEVGVDRKKNEISDSDAEKNQHKED